MKCLVDGKECDEDEELCPTCKRFLEKKYKGKEDEMEVMLKFFRKHPFKLFRRKSNEK